MLTEMDFKLNIAIKMILSFVLLHTFEALLAFPTEVHPEISFPKLESGESSGEIVNQCCQRESKHITVGYGISEGEVRIDVGQCRQKCAIPVLKPLKRDEFDRYLRKYPELDPVQIFLSLQNKSPIKPESVTSGENEEDSRNRNHHQGANQPRLSTSCLQSVCLPSLVKRQSYYDLSGDVKDIDVIESCNCVNLPQDGCQRVSSMVKIHVDTPYEKQMDVGQCIGSCNDDSAEHCLSCRPVRNRTVALDGPNGSQCLSVIDECQCVGECFRIRQFLKVFDYTHVFEAKASLLEAIDLTNNSAVYNGSVDSVSNVVASLNEPSASMDPLTKVIDIGRCSGSCSDVPLASKCLLWSSTNNGTCLSALTGGRSKCTATKFVSHSYTDKSGKKHTVVSVTGCGCR